MRMAARFSLFFCSPCPRSSLYVRVCPPEVEPFPIRLATVWFYHNRLRELEEQKRGEEEGFKKALLIEQGVRKRGERLKRE